MRNIPKAPEYRNLLQFITRHNPGNFRKALEYAVGWWVMCALRFWTLALPRAIAFKLPEIVAPLLAKIPFKRKKLVPAFARTCASYANIFGSEHFLERATNPYDYAWRKASVRRGQYVA